MKIDNHRQQSNSKSNDVELTKPIESTGKLCESLWININHYDNSK